MGQGAQRYRMGTVETKMAVCAEVQQFLLLLE